MQITSKKSIYEHIAQSAHLMSFPTSTRSMSTQTYACGQMFYLMVFVMVISIGNLIKSPNIKKKVRKKDNLH